MIEKRGWGREVDDVEKRMMESRGWRMKDGGEGRVRVESVMLWHEPF